jgi:hypothetical protein
MKKLILYVLLLAITPVFSQNTKGRNLKDSDPFVGEWFSEDAKPKINGIEVGILWLRPDKDSSLVAAGYDSQNAYANPIKFIANTNEKKIIGKSADGKEISFEYKYIQATEIFILVINGQEYAFKRQEG